MLTLSTLGRGNVVFVAAISFGALVQRCGGGGLGRQGAGNRSAHGLLSSLTVPGWSTTYRPTLSWANHPT